MSLLLTPSQTVGPFLRIGFTPLVVDAIAAGASGQAVAIAGAIVDGDRKPVGDAAVEIWQADAEGRYAHAGDGRAPVRAGAFRGFGRILTDAGGAFRFTTIKPGAVVAPSGVLQAPHLVVTLFMRGLLKQLWTRIYFPDDPANVADPVLQRVPAERRATLIARRLPQENSLRWDVVLQGDGETVFFDY